MKRRLLAALAGLTLFSLMAIPAFAMMEAGEEYAFVSDDEVIDDDLFIAAEEVVIDGIVNGDVFAAGAKVTVNGVINGDLYAAAGIVDISGIVTQDVIAIGDTLTFDGATIGDGIITAGSLLSLDGDTTVGGGLIYAGSSMDMDASVARNVIGASATTSIGGDVAKDVLIASEELSLQENASIGGDMKAYSGEEALVDESQVQGTLELIQDSEEAPQQETESLESYIGGITSQIIGFLGALLIGCLMIAFLPKVYARAGKETMEQPVMALVYGLVFLVAVPFASLLLMVSVIGLPLALIALTKYFIVLYIGKIFVASIYAAALTKWTKSKWLKNANAYLVFGLMLLLYFVLKSLPYVGGAVQVISLLLAWGAMMMTANETMKVLKKAKL